MVQKERRGTLAAVGSILVAFFLMNLFMRNHVLSGALVCRGFGAGEIRAGHFERFVVLLLLLILCVCVCV